MDQNRSQSDLFEETKESSPQLEEKDQREIMRDRIRNDQKTQTDTLNTAVMMMRAKDPKRYEKAQYIGNSYMNRSYDLEIGFDNEGAEIRASELVKNISNGLINKSELTIEEIELLNKIYGIDKWCQEIDEN